LYQRNQSKIRRIFFLYALVTTILVLASIFFRLILSSKESYIVITRFHNICEFVFFSTILSSIIINKLVKKAITVSNFTFITVCLIDYFNSSQPTLAYVPLLSSCVFFILIIIVFFFERLKDNSGEPIFVTFSFWFAVALIANFAGNFVLFAYSESALKDATFKINYAIIYGTVTIIKNAILCLSVTMKENPNKNINADNTFLTSSDPLIFNPDKTRSL
jgi:hypothetical protein